MKMSHYIWIASSVLAVIGIAGAVLAFVFNQKPTPKTLVSINEKVPLKVVDKQYITHNTIRLTLGLTSQDHILGTEIGDHIYLSARIDGSLVSRPYTPVSKVNKKGYAEFVIKVYKANVHPNFPAGGKMSQYLGDIPINHYIDAYGPKGTLRYKGDGKFDIKPDERSPAVSYSFAKVNMICGGTGITPMFQLLSHILDTVSDPTKVALLFANNSDKDVLLQDELDALQDKHGDRFRLWYTISESASNWNYSVGYIDEKMITEHLHPPSSDTLVLLCGPNPMLENACYPNLAKLNYARERIYTY